jgi:hypothetical protein
MLDSGYERVAAKATLPVSPAVRQKRLACPLEATGCRVGTKKAAVQDGGFIIRFAGDYLP